MNQKIRIEIAVGLIVAIAILLGMYFWNSASRISTDVPDNATNKSARVACPMMAKLCSDGSSVSATGPNCEFAACPNGDEAQPNSPAPASDVSGWQTYQNDKYGFEIKYPKGGGLNVVDYYCNSDRGLSVNVGNDQNINATIFLYKNGDQTIYPEDKELHFADSGSSGYNKAVYKNYTFGDKKFVIYKSYFLENEKQEIETLKKISLSAKFFDAEAKDIVCPSVTK